jgi:hypothetical protein
MAIFDQRHQTVTYQYNAAGNINVGAAQTKDDLVHQLMLLKAEVDQARHGQALGEEVATDIDYRLTKATQQAQQPAPDKQRLLGYLTEAKTLVEGVATAGGALAGLVTALGQAAQQVQLHF